MGALRYVRRNAPAVAGRKRVRYKGCESWFSFLQWANPPHLPLAHRFLRAHAREWSSRGPPAWAEQGSGLDHSAGTGAWQLSAGTPTPTAPSLRSPPLGPAVVHARWQPRGPRFSSEDFRSTSILLLAMGTARDLDELFAAGPPMTGASRRENRLKAACASSIPRDAVPAAGAVFQGGGGRPLPLTRSRRPLLLPRLGGTQPGGRGSASRKVARPWSSAACPACPAPPRADPFPRAA